MSNNWTDKNMRRALDKASERALRKIGIVIVGQAKLMVPVLSGRLAGSITYATKIDRSEVKKPATAREGVSIPKNKRTLHIGTNVKYGSDVEYGTKAHEIKPKHAKALYWKGAAHPVKIVHHPGTIAQPYLRPAFDRNKKNAKRIYAKELRMAFRGK